MNTHAEELLQIMRRLGLNSTEIGAIAGCSGSTIRLTLASGQLPRTVRARDAIVRFVAMNKDAAHRCDLKFVA